MNIERPEGVELRLPRVQRSLTADPVEKGSRTTGYLVAAIVLAAAAYLAASVSVTTLLIIGAVAALLIGLLFAFGIWVQNNTL